MKDPVGGSSKKKAVPSRYSKARSDAGAMKKFGEHLRAADVSGKGRSAAAGRRQAGLKKAATEITAKKLAGYAPAASSASGTKKSSSKSAAYTSRAGMRKPAAKKRIPNTK